jgi:RNA polymerase I-specific transcription initiation factor RRN5
MDSDTLGDSDYELAGSEASSAIGEKGQIQSSNHQFQSAIATSRSSPNKDNVSSKWNRLRPHHNSKYIDVFNEVWPTSGGTDSTDGLESGHLGAVLWTRYDKMAFFEAIAKTGRHDLRRLSQSMGTKSEVEVKAYLEAILQTCTEMNASGLRRQEVSMPEIPAAIEIGREMENALETAADALSAYQEQYDYALGHHQYNGSFIVDKQIAQELDAESEARQNENNSDGGDDDIDGHLNSRPKTAAPDLFHLATFCDLSQNIFMRGTEERPFDNWMNIAEDGESPSMTQDFVKDFHAIAVSLVQRIVQTVIFITKSRLRAMTRRAWTPSHTVIEQDVSAALQILNVEKSLWDYWVLLPERLGLPVVSGRRIKRGAKEEPLDPEYVRDCLLQATPRGRRSRSHSVAESSAESDIDGSGANKAAGHDSAGSGDDEPYEPSETDTEHSDSISDIESPDEPGVSNQPASTEETPQDEEDEEDEVAETLDQRRRQNEEQRLAQRLGLDSFVSVKSESDERPTKKLRRSRDGSDEWHAPYLAAWEIYNLASDVAESVQASQEYE